MIREVTREGVAVGVTKNTEREGSLFSVMVTIIHLTYSIIKWRNFAELQIRYGSNMQQTNAIEGKYRNQKTLTSKIKYYL